MVSIATLMDRSKAFDSVDHEILLTIHKRYGVHSTHLEWISSYPLFQEGKLCILESDPINIVKYKY